MIDISSSLGNQVWFQYCWIGFMMNGVVLTLTALVKE